uniref:Uncharacterized protein n=1 Tax=viral metagenome TaxID=1070528 RepID=A0A6C0HT51_9ZZZZ
MLNVDEEWLNYLTNVEETSNNPNMKSSLKSNENILENNNNNNNNNNKGKMIDHKNEDENKVFIKDLPDYDELYISTKTKVLFLNQEIDIHNIFWKIPIIEYWLPTNGVVKKQIKIVSKTPEEYEEYKIKLENIGYFKEHIIKQVDSTKGKRIKYKDERKITVGISKKDIMNCRGKVKNAFYNCFAIIVRFKYKDTFREIHVKVFNTGKLEIPGILNPEYLETIKRMVLEIVQPFVETKLDFLETDTEENVLINSNFNCGFYINRDKLYHILKSEKYKIESAYDPCSYPGVKCKYYFNNSLEFDKDLQNGQIMLEDRKMKMSELNDYSKYTEISFMIFRTGSCLIVGNCTERILRFVFDFIKKILEDEYNNIIVKNEIVASKIKKTKLRKKTITQGTYGSPETPPLKENNLILTQEEPTVPLSLLIT